MLLTRPAVTLLFFLFYCCANAQLSVTTIGSPAVINFDATVAGVSNGAYADSGFEPAPSIAGRLSSNAFSVTGWSDGNLAFGGTRITLNTDYTRGISVGGGVTTGGMYAFDLGAPQNRAVGFQPGANDWAPGTFTLKVTNNTGSPVNSIDLSYKLFVRNDQGRSNSFNFSYSTDDITYTSVTALNYSSPDVADASPAFLQVTNPVTSVTIPLGTLLVNGASFYLRWNGADVGGSGSRDEFALDDISVTMNNSGISPCAAPTNQSAGPITFSNITYSSIDGSFPAASPAADRYLVVRSLSSSLTSSPVDGIVYSSGDLLGGGVVVASGSSLSFTAGGLSYGTQYFFFVYAYNETSCTGGPVYKSTSPLTGNSTTNTPPACTGVPGAATALVFTGISGNTISGSFTAGASADEYLVIKSLSPTLSSDPVNTTTYNPGDPIGGGVVVSRRSNTVFAALGLSTSTVYYFFIYSMKSTSCSGGPLYNTAALTGNATTTSGGNGAPAGYYTAAAGLTCSSLKTQLKTIVSTGYVQLLYSDVFSAYATTDTRPAPNNNLIWDMYTDNPGGGTLYNYVYGTNQCGTYNAEGICYNREHSVPASWFSDNFPMYTDLHHLFATDGFVNNKRSNFVYGKVATATYTSQSNQSKLGSSAVAGISGNVFEPIDEYKGDFARAFFYMITRYESGVAFPATNWSSAVPGGTTTNVFSGNTYPTVITSYLDMLYNWHIQDPVSQKEIDRNNAVYVIQGNRNPYVDSPQYVQRVFACASAVVGINEIIGSTNDWRNNIAITPNPVTGNSMTITLGVTNNKRLLLELFDITGRKMLTQTILPYTSRASISIGNNRISSGQCFARISNGKESVVKKVLIIR